MLPYPREIDTKLIIILLYRGQLVPALKLGLVIWVKPSLKIIWIGLLERENHTLFHICMHAQKLKLKGLHRATPIDRLLLQAQGVLPL